MEQMTKAQIRKSIIEKRDEIHPDIRKQWDKEIMKKLVESEYYRKAEVVFTFVNFGSEVDTTGIIECALRDGKTVCVPRVDRQNKLMEAVKIDSLAELKPGYFGILEPPADYEIVKPGNIDFIIMPGVAFDKEGGRIGYGGGFYDKYLLNIEEDVYRIAIAYDFQLIKSVPIEDFDIKIDGIITEKQVVFPEIS